MQYRTEAAGLERRAIGHGVVAGLFNGQEHGLAQISLMLGEVQPGAAVGLHRHNYEELLIIQQGRAVFTIGETDVEVRAGDIVVIPVGVPHRFTNTGDEPLVQTAVHASGAVAIEWLE